MEARFEYDKKEIGRRLRCYRKKANLSVDEVKSKLCLGSVQAIYKWENGITMPAVDNFLALMQLYGVDSIRKLVFKRDTNKCFIVEYYRKDIDYMVWY